MSNENSKYDRFIEWREKHISEKQLVLILSLVVGCLCSIAAFLLKTFIEFIQHVLEMHLASEHHVWYFIFPMIGIALTALFVHYVVKDDISHGITKILYAISQRKSIIKLHNTWSSLVSSAITIGFGGSVGAEAPIVLTGAAIGSNLAKALRLDQRMMMLMIGCGAAGAVAGIFKAPIAGLVFTLEVLLIDLTMSNVAPLLISSVSATALSYLLTGNDPMFMLENPEPFALGRLPWYLLLGVLCGLTSLYFIRATNRLEQLFKQHIHLPWQKTLIGGSVLGLLIFLFPPLYGEGYTTIEDIINGHEHLITESPFAILGNGTWIILVYIVLIILTKVIASVATNGGGGVGGIFAPSLFIGALVGLLTARLLALVGINVPETNFALIGMSGLMSGVMFAPLTGIFLIAELTGGYHLFMPLMIVSLTSYLIIRLFESHSLYAMRLAQKGELLTHNKDRSVLRLMNIESVLEKDIRTLPPDMTLGNVVKVIAESNRDIFPVVDKKGRLKGILLLDEIRNIMFQPRLYDRFTVEELMTSPKAIVRNDTPMEKVMELFEDTGAWTLPVVDNTKRFVGIISKSNIFSHYRELLVEFSEE